MAYMSRTSGTCPGGTLRLGGVGQTGHPLGGVPGNVPLAPSRSSLASDVLDLAYRLARLSPSHRDPEWFHVEKSEIENSLRQISKRLARR
jgi:hypothetical protein